MNDILNLLTINLFTLIIQNTLIVSCTRINYKIIKLNRWILLKYGGIIDVICCQKLFNVGNVPLGGGYYYGYFCNIQ